MENIFPAVFVFKAFVSCAVTNTAGSLGCGEPINTQHYLIHSDYGRVHTGLRVCTRAHPANLLHCLLFFFLLLSLLFIPETLPCASCFPQCTSAFIRVSNVQRNASTSLCKPSRFSSLPCASPSLL